ncbi:MAG: UTP--glucose-1-phosphate uridylyltransferase [Candidatus Micrarchaeota archaeon]|nr:UTP--glucose-1-phosphate uridylyltransferase [Candidatus Micrarchaeota archaeon]
MKVRKAVIPAAGFGTRFLPATKAMPKEMLPIIDKPSIQYVVEEAIAAGIEDIVIITGRGKHAIEDHFDKSIELEHLLEKNKDFEKLEKISEIAELVDIHYVRQKVQRGLPDAIAVGRKHVGDEAFAVLYGDDIHLSTNGKPAIKQVIECAEKYNASVFGVTPTNEPEKYGVIKGKEVEPGVFDLEDIVEKPNRENAPTNLVNSGRNVFTPEFFEAVERAPIGRKDEKHIDAVVREIMKKEKVYACELNAKWYPVGDKFTFVKTTIDFALMHEEMAPEIRRYMQEVLKK